ncbi:unnamed protein product [Meganyctiphanes norvegica]|uniref:Uncharacterized protein n=1 Tax=Meganyctiphanes norvegica TaxID=48144 RepID=A0AAV2QKS9_MEGNR
MKMLIGNISSLTVVLFLIISSEYWSVQCGIFNKHNPVTIQHDLYKFIETTKGTSQLQSPFTIQKEFHNFIRKTGGAGELQSSSVNPANQAIISYVPPHNQQGELNEKKKTRERHKRSLQLKKKTVNPPEMFTHRRNLDNNRYTSTRQFDFGRRDHIPKNNQHQVRPRPREVTSFDSRLQSGFHTHTDRPHTFFRPQKNSHILSKPQKRPNPFLNQPVDPHRLSNFPNIDHRFISQNKKPVFTRPNTKLHNSDILPPVKTSTKPTSRPHGHSNQFSIFNNTPKNTKVHQTSHSTIQIPQTDFDLAFSRPNSRPVDFYSIFGNPMTSAFSVPESNFDGTEITTTRQFNKHSGSGCSTACGLRRSGEVWYSTGCRRSKCITFRGNSFIETDQCDTEIYNTVYKCIIEVDVKANFPGCCPRYRCNPDNLGNLVDRSSA